jgi:hypothetical protein
MLFWIGILSGAGLAWAAIKMGFYETWVLLFNLTVSIYLGLFLYPAALELVPAASGWEFGQMLTMLVIAGGIFALLQGISFVFLTGQFKVPFAKIFDVVFSGVLGFLAGMLVWSFVSLLVCVSPLARQSAVQSVGFTAEAYEKDSGEYLAWWCGIIHNFTGTGEGGLTVQQAISDALKGGTGMTTGAPSPQPTPQETQQKQDETSRKKELGPPPEVGPEEL